MDSTSFSQSASHGPATQDAHYDLVHLLAVAQQLDVDILPTTWQPDLGSIGEGRSANVLQSVVNEKLGLAFKKIKTLDVTTASKKAYREFINELYALRSRRLRDHPNIVDLLGISWDVQGQTKDDLVIHPALVFRNAYGNLRTFMKTDGGSLDLQRRLDMCFGLALGIMAMHESGMAHGDLKPENVIVAVPQDSNNYVFRLIDFGYSSTQANVEGLVFVAGTWPWQAPEHHVRGHSMQAAQRMDMYSFGLVCFWVLFRDQLWTDAEVIDEAHDLERWKIENRFEALTNEMLLSFANPAHGSRARVVMLIKLTLARNPEDRAHGLKELLNALEVPNSSLPVELPDKERTDDPMFELPEYAAQLSLCDFRVRELVFECLQTRARSDCRACAHLAAFQLAFCYELAFGVESNHDTAVEWLSVAGRSCNELETEINGVKSLTTLRKAGELVDFVEQDLIHGYLSRQDIGNAATSYQQGIEAGVFHLGGTHPLVTLLRNLLAHILRAQGRYEDAEASFLAVFDIEKARWGQTHPRALAAMSQVALVWNEQGRFAKAIEIGEELVGLCQSPLVQDDRSCMSAMTNLAVSYQKQGRLGEAESLLIEVIDRSKVALGTEHPDFLKALNNLSSVYLDWAPLRAEEAREILRQVMRTQRRISGALHRDTVAATANWALALKKSGESLEEVLELQEWTLEVSQALYSPDHPDVLHNMLMLGKTKADLGRWAEAQEILSRALTRSEEVLGPEHEATWYLMKYLADVHTELGQFQTSIPLLNRLMAMQRKSQGYRSASPDSLMSMHSLGHAYAAMGDTDEAFNIWTNLHSIAQDKPGLESSTVRKAMCCLANIHDEWGDYRASESLLLKVSEWEDRAPPCRDSLITKNHLATNYYSQDRVREAKRLQVDLMERCQKTLGHEDPLTTSVMANLAVTLTALGESETAFAYHTRALEMRRQVYGPDHEDIVSSLLQLAMHYRSVGQLSDAENVFIQVLEKRKRCLKKDDPDILSAMACLACIYSDQGRMAEAEELERRVLETYRVLFGPDHNRTLDAQANLVYTVSFDPNRLSEAEALQIDILERLKNTVSPDSPRIVTALGQLGCNYLEQRNFDRAFIFFEKEVTGAARMVGDIAHEYHMHALGHLASCHKARGYESEAETTEKLIIKLKEEMLVSQDTEEESSLASVSTSG